LPVRFGGKYSGQVIERMENANTHCKHERALLIFVFKTFQALDTFSPVAVAMAVAVAVPV